MVNFTLDRASTWAMTTTGSRSAPILRDDWIHKFAVVLTGAGGGLLGLKSTLAELPVSTMIMLRSIGCIAEEEGHNANDPKVRMACVGVLAMGADPNKVETDELGYRVARKSVAGLITQAAEWNGRGSVPVLTKLVIEVGKKFGLTISAKVAVQIAPGIGAATGAAINHFFLEHYQAIAHAHFALERLCLKYGEASVRAVYQKC